MAGGWSGMIAKAYVVDAIRSCLSHYIRPVGFKSLCAIVGYLESDVRKALDYLLERNEITHEAHQGYRWLRLYEKSWLKDVK